MAREISLWQRAVLAVSRHRGLVTGAAAVLAAVLSGAVKLHLAAVYYALGAGLLFLVWYVLTDRELQRKIAGSVLMRWAPGVLMALVFLPMMPFFRKGPVLHLVQTVWGTVVLLVVTGYCLAWFLRKRWTGALLADISGPKKIWMMLVFATGAQFFAYLLDIFQGNKAWRTYLGQDIFQLALCGAMYLSFKKEIRQAGILTGGHLIRWGSIRSWSWIEGPPLPEGQPPWVTLKLDLYRPMPLLATARIRMGGAQRESVEAIISRHLGNWPA